MTSGYTTLYGNGFNNRAQGFRSIEARATTGNDKAVFNGLSDGDLLVASGNAAAWQNSRFTSRATGFDAVTARTRGTNPVAAELGAVDFLLEQEGNWRATLRTQRTAK